MMLLKWIVIFVLGLAAAIFLVGQLGVLGGQIPNDIGVKDGRLKPLSDTENSVSSQASLYPEHRMRNYAEIDPLPVTGDPLDTMKKLSALLRTIPGVKVVHDKGDGYLYAQCTTRWLKFVDDLELWVDPVNNVVQVRSASREGRNDLGVNRKRVELLRAGLAAMKFE